MHVSKIESSTTTLLTSTTLGQIHQNLYIISCLDAQHDIRDTIRYDSSALNTIQYDRSFCTYNNISTSDFSGNTQLKFRRWMMVISCRGSVWSGSILICFNASSNLYTN